MFYLLVQKLWPLLLNFKLLIPNCKLFNPHWACVPFYSSLSYPLRSLNNRKNNILLATFFNRKNNIFWYSFIKKLSSLIVFKLLAEIFIDQVTKCILAFKVCTIWFWGQYLSIYIYIFLSIHLFVINSSIYNKFFHF